MSNRSAPLAIALALFVIFGALGAIGASARPGIASPANAATTSAEIPAIALAANPNLNAQLMVSPSTLQEGGSLSVSTTATGGNSTTGYSYSYHGFPAGCTGYNSQSFNCNPSQTGTFTLSVTVNDNHGNMTNSNSVNLQVTSSSGNGNNGGNGNNSSNPFSSLLSGFTGILSLVIIAGIIGLVTWVLLIVGVWIIAIVLYRRLPKRGAWPGAAAAMMKCASCSASMPVGSKFCPECGVSTVPKST